MISGIFITKFTNVSAFWRRKFNRSPRLQYSVITSTGPEEETLLVTTRLGKHTLACQGDFSLKLTGCHPSLSFYGHLVTVQISDCQLTSIGAGS